MLAGKFFDALIYWRIQKLEKRSIASAERKTGGLAPNGIQGRNPGQGVSKQSPLTLEAYWQSFTVFLLEYFMFFSNIFVTFARCFKK